MYVVTEAKWVSVWQSNSKHTHIFHLNKVSKHLRQTNNTRICMAMRVGKNRTIDKKMASFANLQMQPSIKGKNLFE